MDNDAKSVASVRTANDQLAKNAKTAKANNASPRPNLPNGTCVLCGVACDSNICEPHFVTYRWSFANIYGTVETFVATLHKDGSVASFFESAHQLRV